MPRQHEPYGHSVLIGVVGLGSMGKPMARNIAVDGDRVLAYDIDRSAVRQVEGEAIECAADVADVARRCELVLVMVWNDLALRDVIFGERGLLTVNSFEGCVVDLSTTSVALAREIGEALSERGAAFLDGAVIGGGVPAAMAGKSPIVLSGPQPVFERYLPLLQRLGNCDYVGAQGAAKIVKIINNLLVGVVTAANAEALSLGIAAGLRLPDMVDATRDSPASSTVLQSYMGRYVAEGRYGDGLIGHSLMAKDLSLACELASEVSFAGLFAEFGQQMYLSFAQALGGDKPFPSAFDYFRQANTTAKYPLLESTHAS
jgi:3-hydroxyisobutyrate dehydrogenase-like beta-hydroxyacid dehydrogenase